MIRLICHLASLELNLSPVDLLSRRFSYQTCQRTNLKRPEPKYLSQETNHLIFKIDVDMTAVTHTHTP